MSASIDLEKGSRTVTCTQFPDVADADADSAGWGPHAEND